MVEKIEITIFIDEEKQRVFFNDFFWKIGEQRKCIHGVISEWSCKNCIEYFEGETKEPDWKPGIRYNEGDRVVISEGTSLDEIEPKAMDEKQIKAVKDFESKNGPLFQEDGILIPQDHSRIVLQEIDKIEKGEKELPDCSLPEWYKMILKEREDKE